MTLLSGLCVPTKPNTSTGPDSLELSFWSSLSVLWLNELWWARFGGGGGDSWGWELFMLLKRQNFICSLRNSLDSRQHTNTPELCNIPHISSVGFFLGGGEGLVHRAGTETGFCSIMHDNKSQRPVVYCGKLLRLWPKMIRPQGKISQCLLSQTLKNTAWQSINSLLRKREFTSSWRAPAWFSAITIWKGRRWVLQRWCVGGGEIDQRAERKAEGGSAEREERLTCWTWRMDELHSSTEHYIYSLFRFLPLRRRQPGLSSVLYSWRAYQSSCREPREKSSSNSQAALLQHILLPNSNEKQNAYKKFCFLKNISLSLLCPFSELCIWPLGKM